MKFFALIILFSKIIQLSMSVYSYNKAANSSITHVGNVVEPEVIGIHDRPWIHRVGDDGRCVAIQIIVNQVAISHIRQTINRLQRLAGLQESPLSIIRA